jgi:hypothetical protein
MYWVHNLLITEFMDAEFRKSLLNILVGVILCPYIIRIEADNWSTLSTRLELE